MNNNYVTVRATLKGDGKLSVAYTVQMDGTNTTPEPVKADASDDELRDVAGVMLGIPAEKRSMIQVVRE